MHAGSQPTPTYSLPEAADCSARARLTSGVLGLAIVCAWMLLHGYRGLWHDARLYTLQALALLKPELLGNDVFLRFGSQDNYTIFSPLYAAAIGAFGVEPAAALLTFLFQAAFVAAAWLLAHRLLPPRLVLLGVALTIATPGDYGGYATFRYLEDFLTPRLLAEACVLAGLAAMTARRHGLSWGCLLAASVLHPLMAAAGVALVFCVQVAFVRPRIVIAACALSVAGMAIIFGLTPLGTHLRFDDHWLKLVQQTNYLFVTRWPRDDWAGAIVPVITLTVGAITLESSQARTLCSATLLVCLAGIAMTWLGADVLHIVLVTQVQPWRWLWIGGVLAPLLLPLIVGRCWTTGQLGQVAALLLIVVWVLRGEIYAFAIAPMALVAAAVTVRRHGLAQQNQRLVLGGAWILLALALLWALANIRLFAGGHMDDSHAPMLVRQARTWGREGTLPGFFFLGLWWLCQRKLSVGGLRAALFAVLAMLCALLPVAIAEWTRGAYTPQIYRAFAKWRELIPPGNEVFWTDGATPAWLLLERPSYLSIEQAATTLFSRQAGMEIERRSRQLARIPGADFYAGEQAGAASAARPLPTLASMCANSDVRYIVTSLDLAAPALAAAPPGVPAYYRAQKLYGCARTADR